MKVSDVPQDGDPGYEGGKRLVYAVDETGAIVPAHSNGWSVEETAKALAWKTIEAELSDARARVRSGTVSPLFYFMKYRMMDPRLLAQNMGVSALRVRWHLRPRVFAKLSDEWLSRYADCLEIPVDRLRNYKGEDDSSK